jgi:hypothetical protein
MAGAASFDAPCPYCSFYRAQAQPRRALWQKFELPTFLGWSSFFYATKKPKKSVARQLGRGQSARMLPGWIGQRLVGSRLGL